MKQIKKQGFTLVEIMIVVAIIGLLAAIGVPSIMKAYNTSQEKAKLANIKRVEDAKTTLTLPTNTVAGAAGATETDVNTYADDLTGSTLETNMMDGLQIDDWDELNVGDDPITIGGFEQKATYPNMD